MAKELGWRREIGSWLFGANCAACGARLAIADQAAFCSGCAVAVSAIERDGAARPWRIRDVHIRCAFRYGGALSDAIVAAKGRGGRGCERLLRATEEAWGAPPTSWAGAVIVPVAPQRDRLRLRLGHVPDKAADHAARYWLGSRAVRALERVDGGPVRRLADGDGPIFRATIPGHGAAAVLLDDVITTGTTMGAAIATLRDAGWRVIGALAIADARAADDWQQAA